MFIALRNNPQRPRALLARVAFHKFFPPSLILIFCLTSGLALATEDLAPPLSGQPEEKTKTFSTGANFFDDAQLSASLNYFQRKRTRFNMRRGVFENNISHASLLAGADFSSGFMGGALGLDFGAYGSADLYNHGAPDHEMNFAPWSSPWRPDWNKTDTEDGASFYKAHLKARFNGIAGEKDKGLWLKAGYFQPSGPGVLGVNWSFFPGVYLGAETGLDYKGLAVAASYVTQYKAPWFKEMYGFRRADGSTEVDFLWSLGARYNFRNGLNIELAYGESENFLKNAQFKASCNRKIGASDLDFGYHLYAMADSDDDKGSPDNNFDGMAAQHFLFARYNLEDWTVRLEFTYTEAGQSSPLQPGYFAYRLVVPYGGAKGAYAPWWDSRSDWNHDREKAVFAGIWYNFKKFGLPELQAGASAVHGWGGRAYGVKETLEESAFSLDLAYTAAEGLFKGSSLKLHYTRYYNHTDLPSWVGFKNAFQDEQDFKLMLSVPFTL